MQILKQSGGNITPTGTPPPQQSVSVAPQATAPTRVDTKTPTAAPIKQAVAPPNPIIAPVSTQPTRIMKAPNAPPIGGPTSQAPNPLHMSSDQFVTRTGISKK